MTFFLNMTLYVGRGLLSDLEVSHASSLRAEAVVARASLLISHGLHANESSKCIFLVHWLAFCLSSLYDTFHPTLSAAVASLALYAYVLRDLLFGLYDPALLSEGPWPSRLWFVVSKEVFHRNTKSSRAHLR